MAEVWQKHGKIGANRSYPRRTGSLIVIIILSIVFLN